MRQSLLERTPSARDAGAPKLMDQSIDALLKAYHRDGDMAAREEALVKLMPLVRALAARYAGRGEALEDLVQVGSVTLGKGKPLFPRRVTQPPMELVSVRQVGSGFAELRYRLPPRLSSGAP